MEKRKKKKKRTGIRKERKTYLHHLNRTASIDTLVTSLQKHLISFRYAQQNVPTVLAAVHAETLQTRFSKARLHYIKDEIKHI